jgi:para-aminobenzoate synthetase/4-amino-4-deoxychorismate lyase
MGRLALGWELTPADVLRLVRADALVRERATGEWFFETLATDDRTEALDRRLADLRCRATALTSAGPAGTALAGTGSTGAAGYEFGPFRLIPGKPGHQETVGRAVEYIRQGDIFQANICLRAEAGFSGDPLDAFCRRGSRSFRYRESRRLRPRSPSGR